MFATIGTLALLALTLPMDSKCSPIVSQKQNTLRSNVNSPPSQIRYSRFEVLPEYFRRNSRVSFLFFYLIQLYPHQFSNIFRTNRKQTY